MLRPGEFEGRVASHRWVEFTNGPALKIVFQIGVETAECTLFFYGRGEGWSRKKLRVLGFDECDDPAALESLDGPNADGVYRLGGASCKVKIEPDNYRGRSGWKADIVVPDDLPVSRGIFKKIASGATAAAPKPTPTNPGPDGTTHEPGFEDIPF